MDRITKFLKRLNSKEQERMIKVVADIITGNTAQYDSKKLKGHANLYRIRIGDIRVIYLDLKTERNIISIDRRSEKTYKDF
jgi:mRNA-degrading endonuclease RelE of RelBE toxin-antitoxin system